MSRLMIVAGAVGLPMLLLFAWNSKPVATAPRVASESTASLAPPITSPRELEHAQLAVAMKGLTYNADREVVVTANDAVRVPLLAAADYQRGVRLLSQNERIEAVAAFTRAVLHDDTASEHYRGLGEALLSLKEVDRAIAALRTSVARDASNLEARYWLAEALGWRMEFTDAVDQLETLLAQDSQHGRAWSRLAVYRYFTGDRSGSQDALDQAKTLGAATPGQLPTLLRNEVPRAVVRTLPRPGVENGLAPGVSIGPQLRIDGGGAEAANETTIIMNDDETPTIVAAWNDLRERVPGVNISRIVAAVSEDGGETWIESILRPAPPGDSEFDPMSAYDPRTGYFWVGGIKFALDGGVIVARKRLDEPTFDRAIMVHERISSDKPWMVAGPSPTDPEQTRVYVTFNHGIMYSDNLGLTFTWPLPVDLGLGFLPRLGSDGTLYVSYVRQGALVRMVRSATGTEPFAYIDIATRMFAGDGAEGIPGTFRAGIAAYLAIDPNDDTLYAVWYDATSINGSQVNFDIYFSRSDNRGDTWSSPVVVNGDNNPPGDQWMPWIEVDSNGRIHLMYYDTREDPLEDTAEQAFIDVYYSYSDNRGFSWTETPLTTVPFNSELDGLVGVTGSFLGDYQTLAVNGQLAFPCYLSNQNGDSDIFVNRIERTTVSVGDLNCDGVVGVGDINPFLVALTGPEIYAIQFPDCDIRTGDCNGDGRVSVGDINCFVALVTGG